MRPQDFKRWRKALSFSQKEAAEALGLKRRVVQYYEKGERSGAKVKIPKTVRLACAALSHGLADYQGPEKPGSAKAEKRKPDGKKRTPKTAAKEKRGAAKARAGAARARRGTRASGRGGARKAAGRKAAKTS
jgi:transcriptional regulator with XRE-family HTH domain